MKEKTYAETADILKKLEIGGITEELTERLGKQFAELPPEITFSKAAAFLTDLGERNVSAVNAEQKAAGYGVYSFDMEVFDMDSMYTRFLQGVSSLDAAELDFRYIKEDLSGVDLDEGTGKRTVSFEWKGRLRVLEAEPMQDWFDMKAGAALNEIIAAQNTGKRLYFLSDGYQECIVFYRDEEWAKAFCRETGLPLADGISQGQRFV